MKKIKKAIREAEASLQIEGMSLPVGGKNLIHESLDGQISHEEFIRKAIEMSRSSVSVAIAQ